MAEAVFSTTPYKIWPVSAPVGEGANAAFTAANTFIQDFAATNWVADTEVTVENYDNITVTMTSEIVSAFGGEALLQDLWGAGAGSGTGGGGLSEVNLGINRTSSAVTILNDGGADATISMANDTFAGVMSAADKSKLDAIEPGAQVNPTDAEVVAQIDAELGQTVWKAGSHFYDAKVYGVTGDGVTDDGPALRALVDTVRLAGGGIIVLPVGTTLASRSGSGKNSVISLPAFVSITGQGSGASILKVKDPVDANVQGVISLDETHGDVHGLSIENLHLDSQSITGAGTVTLLSLSATSVDATGIFVRNVDFINGTNGLLADGIVNCGFEDCAITDGTITGYGVKLQSCDRMHVKHLNVTGVGSTGLWLENCTNFMVLNSTLEDNVTNIYAALSSAGTFSSVRSSGSDNDGVFLEDCNGVKVIASTFQEAAKHGVKLLDCTYCVVQGVTSRNNGQLTNNTYYDVFLTGSCTYNAVSNNTLIASASNKTAYALYEDDNCDYNAFALNRKIGQVTAPRRIVGPHSPAAGPTDLGGVAKLAVGVIYDDYNIAVSSNGTTVTFSLSSVISGTDLQIGASNGAYTFDVTPAATVALTAGTNTSPTLNYVYIPLSTKTLTKSTTGWPSEEHAPVATVLVPSAALTQTDGAPYAMTKWDMFFLGTDLNSPLDDISKWIHCQPAQWLSGVVMTQTVTTNGGAEDNIDIAVTSGEVLKFKKKTFPARDTGGSDSIYVVNSSVAAYTKTGDLGTILKTASNGATIANNQYANLVIWGSASQSSAACKIMANLPSGFHSSQANAQADSEKYASYSIPTEFKDSGFLIARLVYRYQSAGGGTWTFITSYDLRGQSSQQIGGGAAASSSSFSDALFHLFDNSDSTKVAAFELSGITTGTTRTYTLPDADSTFSVLEIAQSFAAGAKKTFTHSSTTAGLRIGSAAGDPSSPADGDIWYNSSTNKFRKRQNGVTEDLDTQGSAAPGGSDNEFTYNNGGAFGGSSGFIYNETSSRAKAVNGLELPQLSSPSTPATDTMVIFAKARANRSLPAFVDEYGTEFTMGPSQGRIVQGYWKPNGQNTTPATYVFGSSVTGTASVATLASGGFARRLRLNFATASAATNTHSGVRGGTNFIARVSGFYYRVIWGVSGTLNTASRGFFGFTTSSALISGSTEPSAYTNVFGIGWDASQTELRAIYNDGSGAANTSSLGVNFPINGSVDDDIYDCELYCDPANTTDVFYQVTRTKTSTGDTYVATGTMSTDLPASTTTGNFHAHINSGSAAAITTVAIFSQYFETGW